MSCIVSSSYIEVDDKPNVVLILRDSNYKRHKKFIEFYPYFYVREFDYDKLVAVLPSEIVEDIQSTKGGFVGVDGFRLRKVVLNDPHDISIVNKCAI